MKKNITVTASSHPEHRDITLLSVKGFIDTNTAPEFETTFQTVLAEKKYNLIVDLKDTNYISSAGWGIFVGEIKRIRGQKGNLFLAAMSPEVIDAYELLEFDTILKSFPTVDQAVQKGFGRTLVNKTASKTAVEKTQDPVPAAKVSAKPAAVEEPPKVGANIQFAEASTPKNVRKSPFLVRLLLPWKWF